MKQIKLTNNWYIILVFILALSGCKSNADLQRANWDYKIPIVGNSWNLDTRSDKRVIGRRGLRNWSEPETKLRTYFFVEKTGTIDLAFRAKVKSGQSKIKFDFADYSKIISIDNNSFDTIPIGRFKVKKSGYQQLDIQGLKKSADNYADLTDIFIAGPATQGKVYYVKDDFYFGRRGPSVHLNYKEPEDKNIEYFYNEIHVPEEEDVIGSFFMANGFSNGYFGIQVNSSDQRRILFSVWSPYRTNNPEEIPEEDRIRLLKKGPDVNAGKFGGEGSGGQSYRKYFWKAGTTYRFLLKGAPAGNNYTDYTAYFYAPEIGEWQLIASFRRPKTGTYLNRLHSFLENFIPSQGNITRKAYYQNQWVRTVEGKWYELTEARFTADNTARKKNRIDYAGGSEGDKFFMKNCGFFSENVTIGTHFKRNTTGNAPQIDFDKLP
ncbi:MAG TPA: DUF3472 domain-containing protein [bacterium]|nr:DUF3472 domain-containing protein [bacterium]